MRRIAFLAVMLTAAPAVAQEARTITLDEAIDLATRQNAQVDIGEEQIAMAEAKVKETKTFRLPNLAISGQLTVWNEEISIQFEPMAPPVTVRPQVTGQVDVTLAQPITAVFLLGRLLDLEEASVDVARAELTAAKVEIAYQTAELYLSALQAQTLRDVTEASIRSIETNLERVRALRRAEVASDVDILRLEALRDSVKQQVVDADTGAAIARRALVLQLGLPAGTELTLEPVDLTPPELKWTEEQAIALARKRPDVRVAEARIEQSEVGVDVAKADYIPSVNAVIVYSHAEPISLFGAKDSAFLGITASWTIWDWGARGHRVDQAKAANRIATRARDLAIDATAVDVGRAYLTASSKRETLTVAESGLKAAEEAHRLQNVRFGEGAATTSEVIDAETEVARARAQATIARYQYLIAWMNLVRAVGEVP